MVSLPQRTTRAISTLVLALLFGSVVSLAQTGLKASPGTVAFAGVNVGESKVLSAEVVNKGASPITISKIATSSSYFRPTRPTLPFQLAPGVRLLVPITFTPHLGEKYAATITFTCDQPTPTTTVALRGTGRLAKLVATPSRVQFAAQVTVGSSKTRSQTVTNNGNIPLTIMSVVNSLQFAVSNLRVPQVLASGRSVTFDLTFAPLGSGDANEQVVLTTDALNPETLIPVGGTAVGGGTLSAPAGINRFGSLGVGNTKSLVFNLTASNGPITIEDATTTDQTFTLSGLTLPATIPAGTAIPVTVTFAPKAARVYQSDFTFQTVGSNPPAVLSVKGTGVIHFVQLMWDANPVATGYYIYRSEVNGGPYTQMDSVADTVTSYRDQSVESNHTYYYVVSAVDAKGNKSSYSQQVSGIIPP